MQHLEKQVTETEAIASEWKRTLANLIEQYNAAEVAQANARQIREAHALGAAMNDAAAVAAIKAARADQIAAEQTLDDLKIASPAAQERLAAAEKIAASARAELGRHNAEILMRNRIIIAGDLDKVAAEFARLYAQYEALGGKIENMPGALPRTNAGMTNHEGVVGARRVRASLPKFFWKLFPGAIHDEMPTDALANSEARFWNLSPEQPDKAKAA